MILANYSQVNRNTVSYIGNAFTNPLQQFRPQILFRFYLLDEANTTAYQALRDRSAFNNGYNAEYSYQLAPKAGGISTCNNLVGSGVFAGSGIAALYGNADISGAGDITNALGTLLANMTASLTGTGTVSSADLNLYLFLAGDLSGSASLSATLTATGVLASALSGTGDISAANLLGAIFLAGALTGNGDAAGSATATGALLAALAASGTISSADLLAYKFTLAALTGTGDASGTILANGALISAISGTCAVSSSLTGNGALLADILSYGTITNEGVRDAVWSAVASTFDEAGTMGEKLNSAASAGDPWSTALPGAYGSGTAGNIIGNRLDEAISAPKTLTTSERNAIAAALLDLANGVETSLTMRQTLRGLAAVMMGKSSGSGSHAPTFRDTNDTKDRITATIDSNGNRTAVTRDLT